MQEGGFENGRDMSVVATLMSLTSDLHSLLTTRPSLHGCRCDENYAGERFKISFTEEMDTTTSG